MRISFCMKFLFLYFIDKFLYETFFKQFFMINSYTDKVDA